MGNKGTTPRQPSPADLRLMASTMRRWIVAQSFASGVGHIGSALSITDLVAVLWGAVMREPGTGRPGRDRFVLAKGHAALAMYAAMRHRGLIGAADFASYCRDGSPFGVHPEAVVPAVDVSTGSLGTGLSIAVGMAHALRLKRSGARVFALLSDAECNEGQVWEAAQFAAHHGLSGLVAAVDVNGCQALGRTRDILDLAPLSARWRAFGWDAVDADGHDVPALIRAFGKSPGKRPRVVLARTVMGKGVPFMEGRIEWHYRTLSPAQSAAALSALARGGK